MKQEVAYSITAWKIKIENYHNYKKYICLSDLVYTNISCKNLNVRKAADVIFSTAIRGQRILLLPWSLVEIDVYIEHLAKKSNVDYHRDMSATFQFYISFSTPKMAATTSSGMYLLHIYNWP